MLTTISLGVSAAVRLDDFVTWCRSAPARLCFPGARNARGDGAGLHFEVKLRAPGAAPALVSVDEYLRDHGRVSGGLWFETSQVWMWPNRQAGTSWHRYRFRENGARTDLDFEWRLMLPGLAGGQVANAMRFDRSIERAAEIYLERLALRAEEHFTAMV
jgi:hypothetical protein